MQIMTVQRSENGSLAGYGFQGNQFPSLSDDLCLFAKMKNCDDLGCTGILGDFHRATLSRLLQMMS